VYDGGLNIPLQKIGRKKKEERRRKKIFKLLYVCIQLIHPLIQSLCAYYISLELAKGLEMQAAFSEKRSSGGSDLNHFL
jgi:hypothetical protein